MEFRKIFRGYDPQSVDKYIADLTDKNKKIHSSQRERIDELLDENSTLREHIAELQAKENAVSDALVVSRNAALQMERQAKDYSDKALFQAKKFYATWQAYAQTVVSSFTKEELSAFNGLQRKIERVIADYERDARKKAESDIPLSQRMERELEELNRRSRELEEASESAAAASFAESAVSSEQSSAQEQGSMQNPIDKVEKAAEQVIDLRELVRANDSLEDLCADLGLVGGKSEK